MQLDFCKCGGLTRPPSAPVHSAQPYLSSLLPSIINKARVRLLLAYKLHWCGLELDSHEVEVYLSFTNIHALNMQNLASVPSRVTVNNILSPIVYKFCTW